MRTSVDNALSWHAYSQREVSLLKPMLLRLGFALDDVQVHIGGERAVISGRKVVLLGTRLSDGERVVIKASSTPEGKQELEREHRCRIILDQMPFAYTIFLSAAELIWHKENNVHISITIFLNQDQPFLARPLKEQFFLALKAFETQAGAHATTYEHKRVIRTAFRIFETNTYLTQSGLYRTTVKTCLPTDTSLHHLMERAHTTLQQGHAHIDQYNGFLTHGDFVPHNIRVVGRDLYLLDHSDIRFGNKYDGWARFLNFMLLHHRDLEGALVSYLEKNCSPEECRSLHLMRIYRFMELIWYYTNRLEKSTGALRELDHARIFFWADALQATLDQTPLPEARIKIYQTLRDSLRSEEEKERQKGLH